MPVLGRTALVVLAGGVALGAMLGAAANPVMKMPPERPWQGALQAPATDTGYLSAGYVAVEASPHELSPYRDSYAPTWALEELTDWEPEYPAWTYSELVDEPRSDAWAAEDASIAAQQVVKVAEAAAPPEMTPQPVTPPDVVSAPSATPAPYQRHASHLDDIY